MEIDAGYISRRDMLKVAGLAVASGLLVSRCDTSATSHNPSARATETPPTSEPSSTPELPTSTPSPLPTATPLPRLATAPANAANLPSNHFIRTGPANKPSISITVDDFTNNSALDYLEGLLQFGRERNTKFTLFPTGQALKKQQHKDARRTASLWNQAIDDGHSIGNHTWDHDEKLAEGTSAHIEDELARQLQALNDVLGKDYAQYLMRPPGGSGGYPNTNPDSKMGQQHAYELAIVKQLGFWMTMWSIDSNDPKGNMVSQGNTAQQQDDRFLGKIFNSVGNGSIILVHPQTLTLGGMGRLIDGLHSRNYNCVSVPELFV